ncbi:radical SAM protein [Terasakiella sp. SH-1]|uniref:radical SAM protein n=1 Tax=Terasakiella sp. SH-1 TaxID=2560057 RepID=UPI0010743079|nr:radical SAM protein [Terasakiella sp. SH-1]
MDNLAQYQKFEHPDITAKGETRALVGLTHLHTVWFNTGSLCNITCKGCYMDSSPQNDALAYISAQEVATYLDEMRDHQMDVREIGFTGGEPFMNPEIIDIITDCLERDFRVLVLTNAMKPLHHKKEALLSLKETYGGQLSMRVSVDHYRQGEHEALRGEGSWTPMIEGLSWLAQHGFNLAVAGRTIWPESEERERQGYGEMFAKEGIAINPFDPVELVLFPEMDEKADVPEITTACWDIVGVQPEAMMCASSRMIIKRKGAAHPVVVPCTLLPYDEKFEMGRKLSQADKDVKLNHPHCAKFCVLGGGACSKT